MNKRAYSQKRAKAHIDLKKGIIDLEGPVEFVNKYLDKYSPKIKDELDANKT